VKYNIKQPNKTKRKKSKKSSHHALWFRQAQITAKDNLVVHATCIYLNTWPLQRANSKYH